MILPAKEHDDRSYALRACDAIIAVASTAGLLRDRRIHNALRVIRCNPTDQKTIHKVLNRTMRWLTCQPRFLAIQADKNPFLPYPTPLDVGGPLRLGTVYNPIADVEIPYGLTLTDIIRHVLISGNSGSGKTTTIRGLLMHLLSIMFPFLVIDLKGDCRIFLRFSPRVQVHNWRTMKDNPYEPPAGVPLLEWLQTEADVFFESHFDTVPMAAKSAYIELVAELCDRFAEEHGPGVFPSPLDVEKRIEELLASPKTSGRYKECLRTVQSRLRPRCRILGDMYDCQSGFPIEELVKEPVVLELDGLSAEYQAYTLKIFFFKVFRYRLSNAHRGKCCHVFVFDEAKMIFAADKAGPSSLVARLISQSREFGEGCIFSEQLVSCLSHAVLANVSTIITLSLSAAKDIQHMAYAMGLNPEQRQFLHVLPDHFAVVKMHMRHRYPFLVVMADCPVDKSMTNDEVARLMAPRLRRFPFVPRVASIVRTGPTSGEASAVTVEAGEPATNEETHTAASPSSVSPSMKGDAAVLDPASLEFALLVDIRNHPWLAVTERSAALHLTSYKSNRGLRSLERLGLVEAVEIHLGGRGRAIKFFALTEAGQALVGPQNLGPGKGGFEHVFRQRQIRDHFAAQGYETTIEHFVNGKAVDVGLARNSERVAVEIGMSAQHEAENIEKDLRAGWPEVWSYARDAGVRDRIQREWSEREAAFPGAVVRFFLLSDIPK